MEFEQFLCSICLEKCIQPRITECFHSFCENCLFTFAFEEQKRTSLLIGANGFECPVCRNEINLPSDNVTKEWIIETFPLNFKIIKNMEIENESTADTDENGHEHNTEYVACAPCKESGEEHFAAKYCLNCCEALCKTCCEWHKKFKLFKQHEVVALSSCKLFQSTENTDKFEKHTKCEVHSDKDIVAFCEDHARFCCIHCITNEHRLCKAIQTKDIGNKADTKANRVAEMYTNAQEHIDALLNLEKGNRDSLLANIENVSDKIITFKDEIISKLNEQYADTMSHLKEIRLLVEGSTGNGPKLVEMRDRCVKQLEYLEAVKSCKSKEHVFILSRALQSELSEIETGLKRIDTSVNSNVLSVEICDELKQLKEKLQMQDKVISVKLETFPMGHNSFVPMEDLGHDYRAKKISPVQLEVPHSSSPVFTCVSCSKSEEILLFDRVSSDLYLYDISKKTTLKSNVGNVHSVLKKDNAYIASKPDQYTVSRYLEGELPRRMSWRVDVKPYLICHVADNRFVVSTREPDGFLFFTITPDSKLHQMKHLTSNEVGEGMKATEYFAVDEKRMRLIQTCTEPNEVNCLTFDGEEIFCFRHKNLVCPQGIALDKNGNSYVCVHSYFKPSVFVISIEGKLLNVIEQGIPKTPLAICSDITGKRFWITSNYAESSTLLYSFELVKTAQTQ